MTSRITAKTKVIGLFGSPVSHSRSPLMQNTVYEAMGLDYVYVAFDVGLDAAGDAVQALRTLNLRGANVTMPLKRAIIPYLDRLSPAAEMARSVNVIVNDNGELTGHVTDGEGFLLSLADAGVPYAGRHMIVLGAGGAGTSVIVQAALEGVARLSVFNRPDAFFEEAAGMIASLKTRTGCEIELHGIDDHEALAEAIGAADILVNATPLGMEDSIEAMALPDPDLLRPELAVCDLIYVPRETRFLKEAARRGCKTVSGLGMQLYQALPAFRMWTGQEMDVELARSALFGGAK